MPIFLEELFGGLWCTLVLLKAGGNAAHFSGGAFRWPLVHISRFSGEAFRGWLGLEFGFP